MTQPTSPSSLFKRHKYPLLAGTAVVAIGLAATLPFFKSKQSDETTLLKTKTMQAFRELAKSSKGPIAVGQGLSFAHPTRSSQQVNAVYVGNVLDVAQDRNMETEFCQTIRTDTIDPQTHEHDQKFLRFNCKPAP